MRRLLISTALLSASATSALAEPSALEKAYAKELAYLKAEKAALEARLAATDLSTLKAEKQLESELGAAEDRLLLARRRAEEIEGRLRGLERQSDGEERSSFVRESVARAEETLGGYGVSASSDPEALLPDAVRSVFVSASRAIEEGTQLRRGPGTFFLADGRQVDGQLVHWGRVAAFGDSPEGAGILVPAGGGRLRVWDEPAAAVAVALARGSAPAVLRTFLFEATDVAVKKREAKTVAKELALGGSIAYVIAALGLLALLMVMLRSVRLLAEGARVGNLVDEVVVLVTEGRLSQARERVAAAGGTMARVLQSTLDALAGPRAQRDDVVHEAMLREIPGVERFSSAILVFAAVAPLLGLLGTVTGMISTFDVITEFGTGDPRMLSGGISEALITTKLGLVVAIPALLAGTLLNGRADALLASIQYGTLRVLNAADRDKEHAAPSTAAKTNAAESALAFGAPVTGSS